MGGSGGENRSEAAAEKFPTSLHSARRKRTIPQSTSYHQSKAVPKIPSEEPESPSRPPLGGTSSSLGGTSFLGLCAQPAVRIWVRLDKEEKKKFADEVLTQLCDPCISEWKHHMPVAIRESGSRLEQRAVSAH